MLPRLHHTVALSLVGFSSGPWTLSYGGNWPRLWILANSEQCLTLCVHPLSQAGASAQLTQSHPQASVTARADGPGEVQPLRSQAVCVVTQRRAGPGF